MKDWQAELFSQLPGLDCFTLCPVCGETIPTDEQKRIENEAAPVHPSGVPLWPDVVYPEWQGWRDFLGSDTCCDKCGN